MTDEQWIAGAQSPFLRRKGFRTRTNTPSGDQWFFLYFWNASMEETRKSLNVWPRWSITFGHCGVSLSLELDRRTKEEKPVVDRITKFMKENPIDASLEGGKKYPMEIRWAVYFIVYDQPLMTDEELSATPLSEVEDVTLRRMAAFLNLDFIRIETYLKCMAFDPAVPA